MEKKDENKNESGKKFLPDDDVKIGIWEINQNNSSDTRINDDEKKKMTIDIDYENEEPKINFQEFEEKEEKKINKYSKNFSEILKEKELENSLKNESIEKFEEIKISKIENNNKDKKSGIQEDKKISIHKIKTNNNVFKHDNIEMENPISNNIPCIEIKLNDTTPNLQVDEKSFNLSEPGSNNKNLKLREFDNTKEIKLKNNIDLEKDDNQISSFVGSVETNHGLMGNESDLPENDFQSLFDLFDTNCSSHNN